MADTPYTRSFTAGTVIFKEGEEGTEMYVIKEGQVDLKLGDLLLERMGPDDLFGEMALIDEPIRSATAVAFTDCTVDIMSQKQFVFRVQEMPFFALKVMKLLAHRLRETDRRLAPNPSGLAGHQQPPQ